MEYPIDYSLYDTEEIVIIVNFLNLLEQYQIDKKYVEKDNLLQAYFDFNRIINNKSEEKKIDQAFEKQTGISIYHTIKEIKSTNV